MKVDFSLAEKPVVSTLRVNEPDTWPEPQPIAASFAPEPYPLESLPGTVKAAVREVAGFVKAPVPLVASSALAALSLAIQSRVDVQRAEKLSGPTGLFMVALADSGERKTTCDSFFTKAIRSHEDAQAEAAKPLWADHRADVQAWEAKQGGVKDRIRLLAKQGKPTRELEDELRDLEHDKPTPPRVPRLLWSDATPEALANGLAKQWPSAGLLSSEGGTILGGHAMGRESAMRNMAMLNQLWDGASLTVDRRTSESFAVRGARLTMCLQVQESVLREFLGKSGTLARGSGFLARFLLSWPESTQGTRMFSEPPASWPALSAFNQRLEEILNQPEPINEDGELTPAMLALSPEAKRLWISFHDEIEGSLACGQELYEVRDIASKVSDNAARLAALFQVFEHGESATVNADCFDRASGIVAWHLNESRRFFGELALPPELANAARLDGWLTDHCRQIQSSTVNKRHLRQHGPIRDGATLDSAVRELAELDRLRLRKVGRRIDVELNPALVEVLS